MELSPSNPSYLDERNAILSADTAVFGGRDSTTIWKVFAGPRHGLLRRVARRRRHRPGADFHTPPTNTRTADVTGTVTDRDSASPSPA
jgi:hypothetical protein